MSRRGSSVGLECGGSIRCRGGLNFWEEGDDKVRSGISSVVGRLDEV